MSFQGFRDLDRMITEEISSLDKLGNLSSVIKILISDLPFSALYWLHTSYFDEFICISFRKSIRTLNFIITSPQSCLTTLTANSAKENSTKKSSIKYQNTQESEILYPYETGIRTSFQEIDNLHLKNPKIDDSKQNWISSMNANPHDSKSRQEPLNLQVRNAADAMAPSSQIQPFAGASARDHGKITIDGTSGNYHVSINTTMVEQTAYNC